VEKDSVEQIVKDHIVKEFLYDRPATVLDSRFPLVQEGVVDSLGIFRLIGFIENTFGIPVAPEDVVVENFATVDAITSFITGKLSAQSRRG